MERKKENLKSLNDMAKELDIHPATLRGWARMKMLPYYRIGKKYFFDPDEIREASRSENSYAHTIDKLSSEHNGIAVSNGYIQVYIGQDPLSNKAGYIPLHRLIMQAKLKKDLNEEEIVHHKNGDTLDNRVSNLEIKKSLGAHNSEKRFQREDRDGKQVEL